MSEADLKAAGLETVVRAASTSTLILGKEKGEEVVFTFHPGEPVRPTQLPAVPELVGKTVTMETAFLLGFEYVKVTP